MTRTTTETRRGRRRRILMREGGEREASESS